MLKRSNSWTPNLKRLKTCINNEDDDFGYDTEMEDMMVDVVDPRVLFFEHQKQQMEMWKRRCLPYVG